MTSTRSLFVTNNGLSDHIGTAQVLPYLEGLSTRGHQMACLSAEHPNRTQEYLQHVAPRLEQACIDHDPIWRQKSSLVGKLERFAMPSVMQHRLDKLVSTFKPDMIHCRSYMPLAAVLQASQHHNIPFIFDMRGFWIDERCEAGVWHGPVGRTIAQHFRKLEAKAIKSAASIVVLTHDAKTSIAKRFAVARSKITVIPCSVDQAVFRPDRTLRATTRTELGFSNRDLVLAHLGSAGPLYQMGTTYRLWAALKSVGIPAKLLMIGDQNAEQHIAAARLKGISLAKGDVICRKVPHAGVPALLNAADIGLSFRIPSRSSLGVSATKVAEYMSCGLPVISNAGIGDINQIVPDRRFGLVLAGHEAPAIENAAHTIASGPFRPRDQIQRHSSSIFNLATACDSYDGLYRVFSNQRKAA